MMTGVVAGVWLQLVLWRFQVMDKRSLVGWNGPLVSAKRTNQLLRSIISILSSLNHPPTTSTLSTVNQMPFSPFSMILVRCRVALTC